MFSFGSSENEKLSMSYNHMVAPYKLLSKTIGETVDEAAEKYGDKESLVFSNDNIRMTFVQLKEKVSYVSCYRILFNGTTAFSLNVFLLLLILNHRFFFSIHCRLKQI